MTLTQAEVTVRHMLDGLPQPAPSDDLVERVAELQLAAFLAGRGSVTHKTDGPRVCKLAPSMDDFRRMAITAIGQDTRSQVEQEIVAWLRSENGTCDCFAHSSSECACGAWDDYKVKPLCDLADAIEQAQYRSEG